MKTKTVFLALRNRQPLPRLRDSDSLGSWMFGAEGLLGTSIYSIRRGFYTRIICGLGRCPSNRDLQHFGIPRLGF